MLSFHIEFHLNEIINFSCHSLFIVLMFSSFEAISWAKISIIITIEYLVELNWLISCFYLSFQFNDRERIEPKMQKFYSLKQSSSNANIPKKYIVGRKRSIRFPSWATLNARTDRITDEKKNRLRIEIFNFNLNECFDWTPETGIPIEDI